MSECVCVCVCLCVGLGWVLGPRVWEACVCHLQKSVGGVKGDYAYDLGTRLSALK